MYLPGNALIVQNFLSYRIRIYALTGSHICRIKYTQKSRNNMFSGDGIMYLEYLAFSPFSVTCNENLFLFCANFSISKLFLFFLVTSWKITDNIFLPWKKPTWLFWPNNSLQKFPDNIVLQTLVPIIISYEMIIIWDFLKSAILP